jgi:hypothetical protein
VAIADRIVEKAAGYGIGPERIYVDPLVLALSTANDSMLAFMDALRRIKERHPTIKSTSGLSNISFGMPYRKAINVGFLILALSAGMDSAIIDSTNKDTYAAILSAEALLGKDRTSGLHQGVLGGNARSSGRVGAEWPCTLPRKPRAASTLITEVMRKMDMSFSSPAEIARTWRKPPQEAALSPRSSSCWGLHAGAFIAFASKGSTTAIHTSLDRSAKALAERSSRPPHQASSRRKLFTATALMTWLSLTADLTWSIVRTGFFVLWHFVGWFTSPFSSQFGQLNSTGATGRFYDQARLYKQISAS